MTKEEVEALVDNIERLQRRKICETREGGVDAIEKAEVLKEASKAEVLDFIRKELKYKEMGYAPYARFPEEDSPRLHRRFNMSGYENKVGECTTHNNAIIETFAHLGIYDYYDAIAIDFYKGCGKLFFIDGERTEAVDVCGYTTSEIIYEIFIRTILTDKGRRRRY